MADYDYSTTLDTLKRLKEVFQIQDLSEYGRLIACGFLIDSEIYHITGIHPTVGPEEIAWAQKQAEEIAAEAGGPEDDLAALCR